MFLDSLQRIRYAIRRGQIARQAKQKKVQISAERWAPELIERTTDRDYIDREGNETHGFLFIATMEDMMSREDQLIAEEERLQALLEDLQAIMTERVWNSRVELIKGKWEIGDRVLEEIKDDEGVYGKRLVGQVAQSLHISESEIYRCVQFRKNYPDQEAMWEQLPDGKNISWRKIKTLYLPDIPSVDLRFSPTERESPDQWNLVSWWKEQGEQNLVLRIKGDDPDLVLVVKPEKVAPDSEKKAFYKAACREVVDFYIDTKKFNKEDVHTLDYKMYHPQAINLLRKAKWDKQKAKNAVQWCHDKFSETDLTWTLGTVVKQYFEFTKPVKPYAKYLKKKKHY